MDWEKQMHGQRDLVLTGKAQQKYKGENDGESEEKKEKRVKSKPWHSRYGDYMRALADWGNHRGGVAVADYLSFLARTA